MTGTRIQVENLGWASRDPSYRPRCTRCSWVGTVVYSRQRASTVAELRHPVCAEPAVTR